MNAVRRKNGWPYFIIATSICMLILISRDIEIPIFKLLAFGLAGGYILGVLWFSTADLLIHWYRWIFDVRNYRHYMKGRKKKPRFELRLMP